MKKDLATRVEKLIKDSCAYFNECISRYEKMYKIDLNQPTLTFYTVDVCYDYSELSGFIDTLNGSKMVTLQTIYGNTDPNLSDDDQIIETISSQVLMSYQSVFEVILDCNMNFDDAFEYIKHVIRHEFGHIIDRSMRLVGKKVKVWNRSIELYEEEQKQFAKNHKLRKNASRKNALQWLLDYHHLIGEEVNANSLALINDEEIITMFELTHKSI